MALVFRQTFVSIEYLDDVHHTLHIICNGTDTIYFGIVAGGGGGVTVINFGHQ